MRHHHVHCFTAGHRTARGTTDRAARLGCRQLLVLLTLATIPAGLFAQDTAAPEGLRAERQLPDRYPHVVRDALAFCQPRHGFWVDLGAGKGQVAIPLVAATDNPVVMLDPDADAMQQGLARARQQGLEQRVFAVVGKAEALPFPDNSVDLVISRGSIFFWDDPAQGLREVYRVLRPGARAYIGGGAGSGYPPDATRKLIAGRVARLSGKDAAKWQRLVALRRPEQMQQWAQQAELPAFTVMGKGAISAEDQRVGQGVWLLLTKKPAPNTGPAPESAGEHVSQ